MGVYVLAIQDRCLGDTCRIMGVFSKMSTARGVAQQRAGILLEWETAGAKWEARDPNDGPTVYIITPCVIDAEKTV